MPVPRELLTVPLFHLQKCPNLDYQLPGHSSHDQRKEMSRNRIEKEMETHSTRQRRVALRNVFSNILIHVCVCACVCASGSLKWCKKDTHPHTAGSHSDYPQQARRRVSGIEKTLVWGLFES